jgi:hypothetical protein
VILSSVLYDLQGPKVLATSSFLRQAPYEDFISKISEQLLAIVESDEQEKAHRFDIDGNQAIVHRVGDATFLIVLCDSDEVKVPEETGIDAFAKELVDVISTDSLRKARLDFGEISRKHLATRVSICFFSDTSPSTSDNSGNAVAKLLEARLDEVSVFTKPLLLGPFEVYATRADFRDIPEENWPEPLRKIDSFVLVASKPLEDQAALGDALRKIRVNSTSEILVVPGSDSELELARDLENSFFMTLCDSVSSDPVDLLLSVLAISGFTFSHPELAKEKWFVQDVALSLEETTDELPEDMGHQAFFVINKATGEARFTYLYERDSVFMQTAPNVVAAVSMFQLDSASPTSTSVFRAGGLKYVIIERSSLIFTLVTGEREDVEVTRSRFSFLPDLYLDESPENVESSEDLYSAPPFTLKLLATLPPEDLGGRALPYRLDEPEWDRFESGLVRDFLTAVWGSIDGKVALSDLATGNGTEMIVGALHLLRRMGSIEWRTKIVPGDIPILTGRMDDETSGLYSHLESITEKIDGNRSISQIGEELNVQPDVLLTVFAELYRRSAIDFKE